MKTVYLCGPINKCSDSEASDWRESAKKELTGFNLLDPMHRDYRGRELEPGIANEIVVGDKADYRRCHFILAYCPKPSVGTSMEIFDAYENRFCVWKPWTWLRKRVKVIVVHPDDKPSPWLVAHSHKIVRSFAEAFEELTNGE